MHVLLLKFFQINRLNFPLMYPVMYPVLDIMFFLHPLGARTVELG